VSLKRWMFINALVFIAFGIAFVLYAPLVVSAFEILKTEGTSQMYWYSVSFARLYGAALFGFGFLIWAVSSLREALAPGSSARQSIAVAMLLANGLGVIVAITQQVSVWGALAGWITAGMYAILMGGYIIALAKRG
jgi:hypothetical protein